MSRPSKDDRRTMPPLPAAGVRPLDQLEPSPGEGSSPVKPPAATPSSPAGSNPQRNAPAEVNVPEPNPLNFALLELQGEASLDESPLPSAPQPARPETELKPTPTPTTAPVPPLNSVPPEQASATSPAPQTDELTTEPQPSTAATSATASARASLAESIKAMSSTPPISSSRPKRPADRLSPTSASASLDPVESRSPLPTILVGGMVVWFLIGILGAWTYDQFIRKPELVPETTAAAPEDGSTSEALAALGAAELDPLKAQLGDLGKQVEAFEKQLAAKPDPAGPAPADLASVRQQLDEVAKSAEGIEPLSKRLQTLGTRMEGLETSIDGLKGELGSLQASVPAEPQPTSPEPKPSAVTPPAAVPTSTPAVASPASAPAPAEGEVKDSLAGLPLEGLRESNPTEEFAEGVKLYKAQKYKAAYTVFEKLSTTTPNDARVWYYAALSYGLAEDDFSEKGKTPALLKKGFECEKKGSPAKAEIDAAFRDLESADGKEWLEYKRKMGLK